MHFCSLQCHSVSFDLSLYYVTFHGSYLANFCQLIKHNFIMGTKLKNLFGTNYLIGIVSVCTLSAVNLFLN